MKYFILINFIAGMGIIFFINYMIDKKLKEMLLKRQEKEDSNEKL